MNRSRRSSIASQSAIDRRRFLGSMAAGLAAPSLTALGRSRGAPANIRLGVMSSVYADLPVAEAARQIQADGFSCVVCDFSFADVRFDPLAPDWNAADTIRQALDQRGIAISSLYGYYNLVDPDLTRRQRGKARIEALLAAGKRLGCTVVSTETGTLNTQSEWLDVPENASEEAYLECRAVLRQLAALGEKQGSCVAIEPYWQNVIRSIERAARLIDEVPSPGLKLVMDPCNYYRKEDLPRMAPMLRSMFVALGDRIVVGHAKDVKAADAGTDLPAAGLGVLDYPLYLQLLADLNRPIDLILEHLARPDIPRARDYVRAHLDKVKPSPAAPETKR